LNTRNLKRRSEAQGFLKEGGGDREIDRKGGREKEGGRERERK